MFLIVPTFACAHFPPCSPPGPQALACSWRSPQFPSRPILTSPLEQGKKTAPRGHGCLPPSAAPALAGSGAGARCWGRGAGRRLRPRSRQDGEADGNRGPGETLAWLCCHTAAPFPSQSRPCSAEPACLRVPLQGVADVYPIKPQDGTNPAITVTLTPLVRVLAANQRGTSMPLHPCLQWHAALLQHRRHHMLFMTAPRVPHGAEHAGRRGRRGPVLLPGCAQPQP